MQRTTVPTDVRVLVQGLQCSATAEGPLSATQPSDTPRVTKKVFFDIKQGNNSLGRITIGLYGERLSPLAAARWTANIFFTDGRSHQEVVAALQLTRCQKQRKTSGHSALVSRALDTRALPSTGKPSAQTRELCKVPTHDILSRQGG